MLLQTVKTTSKTKKLLENKEEQLNQLKETLEANEIRARERQVEKDEDGCWRTKTKLKTRCA